MLIKRLDMFNFRQFKGKKSVEFACHPENNITLIMGENGAGKTTLAQAFLWVLYGQTEFKDKKVVNKKAIEEVATGTEVTVKIDLVIEEENIEYTITRIQEYINKGIRVEAKQAILEIKYKKNGQIEFMNSSECENFVKNLLPQELSKFFIFSGERIKSLSDEIQDGRSKEFANAVRSLVGLNGVMNAIRHIKGIKGVATSSSASTVIGRYNKKIDDLGDVKLHEINKRIESNESKAENLEVRKKQIEPNIDFYKTESIKLEQQILNFAPAEKVKRDYESLGLKIKDKENDRVKCIKNYLRYFNNNGLAFFTRPVIEHSSEILKSQMDSVDKGIPHMHAQTIEYLIKKGRCVCGHEIGDEEINELNKLLEYLPPKSIGTSINLHNKTSKDYIRESKTFFSMFESQYTRVREIEKNITELTEKQTNLYHQIVDLSNLQNLRNQKDEYDRKAKQSQREFGEISSQLGELHSKIKNDQAEREKCLLQNSKNREFILYRDYATALYEKLNDRYNTLESHVRDSLEERINRIFTSILEDGLQLKLDNNYNIKVSVNELKNEKHDIEQSTAQSYSVIFAFIAGIIEMAKEKSEDEENSIFDNAVGYPLVMDAPLSAFDKKRISNVCDTLPNIAQQVIIFIKDTDGDVAEKHLATRVGKKYNIVKVNESLIVSDIKVGV